MSGPPTGTVTLLFTDIEGSTRLLNSLGDLGYGEVLERHYRLLRATFEQESGHVIDTEGDAFFVGFQHAENAVAAAIAAQRAIAAHPWPEGVDVRVRMGLHTGTPANIASRYVGLDVHRAARICAAAHGGQILLSLATARLVENSLPPGAHLRDLGSHGFQDLPQPERVFQLLHPDLSADFPPLRSTEIFRNNLPHQLTCFIGREQEMAEVKRLLSATRLLTLTGTGGCGKTRLALQVAAEILDRYVDGVWLVELAALSNPALVPQAVASVLGVREEPNRALVATLLNFLRPRSLLLVLDNCEHLIGTCASLAEALLRECPRVHIIATSQEALSIAGELVYRVPSFSLPDLRALPALEQLIRYEGIRLFVERAALGNPAFTITQGNAHAVVQVVNRLDGIPLAIELAAARIKALPVETIAARLDDRFRLLAGGPRTALPRHQTLRAALDWSFSLLSEKEKMLLSRLSVFAGGFSLEACEGVCPGSGIDDGDIVDVLIHLVEKSLVILNEVDGQARYRLLETVRQYIRDKLRDSGEAAGVQLQHRDWYLGLAERAESELLGPDQGRWLERLEIDHDNLRAALMWSMQKNEVEPALRLAGALWRFWYLRGYFEEGRRLLEEALKRGSSAPAELRAKGLNGAGNLAGLQGDYAAATSHLEEGLMIQRALGSKVGIASSLNYLGNVAYEQGDGGLARSLFEESLVIYRELGDKSGIALLLNNLGRVLYTHAELPLARAFLREGLAIFEEIGSRQGIALSLNNLGNVALNEGDFPLARSLLERSLTIRRQMGERRGIALTLSQFARLALAERQAERAVRMFGAAETLRGAIGHRLPPFDRAHHERLLAAARATLDEETYARSLAEGRAMTLDEACEYALAGNVLFGQVRQQTNHPSLT